MVALSGKLHILLLLWLCLAKIAYGW
jgi:hypothetical protein